jgi:hypothetical protein
MGSNRRRLTVGKADARREAGLTHPSRVRQERNPAAAARRVLPFGHAGEGFVAPESSLVNPRGAMG